MADIAGPFDSGSWSQTEWYVVAPTWAPSGIIGSPAASVGVGDFAVTASGLTITVACNGDRAHIDGSGYRPDSDKTVAVTPNGNASLSRRDRIVIRRDLAAQTITVARLTGTPAGSPASPAPTQTTSGVYEVPVCSFLVPPNNGTALSGFIDERQWVDPGGGSTIDVDAVVLSGVASDSLRFADGQGSVTFSAISFVFTSINYAAAGFTAPPRVFGSCQSNSVSGLTVHFTSITNTGADVLVRSTGNVSATVPFDWIAVGR